MQLIIGLGNPGKEYSQNRHNIGFHCINYIARKYSISVNKNQCQASIGRGIICNEDVLLAKPKTYVNNSGVSVANLMRKYRIPANKILVIYDDMDLPLGKIRIRQGGSAGGHKGMKSIISAIGTDEFSRMKVGIDRPRDENTRTEKIEVVVNHVLSNFTSEEITIIKPSVELVAGIVECILSTDIITAMNKYN